MPKVSRMHGKRSSGSQLNSDVKRSLRPQAITTPDPRLQESDHDPTHILKGLDPSFPLQDLNLDNQYWARTYAIRDIDPVRLVVLNSSHYHGYTEIEKNHGRIDENALLRLKKDLSELAPLPINILLCHHHPHQHSELGLGQEDVMKMGQQLLDILGSGRVGRWLVIHGHKHHPKIAYAAEGSSSPTVFAAGSLCAILSGALQTEARNQFYLIEIDPTLCTERGMVGKVKSWDWSGGVGWIEASTRSGLPAEFGFGARQDPAILAAQIAALVTTNGAIMSWSAVGSAIPDVQFLIPQDLEELIRLLKNRHALSVSMDGTKVVEVGSLPA